MNNRFFCAKENGKLNYGKTALTGFGFLAASIAWAIYDPYITKILNHLLNASPTVTAWSNTLVEKMPFLASFAASQGEDVVLAGGGFTLVPLFIGIIMTFDNIFGVIFQPTFGKLSDRCHSRFGKRRPFILFGAPISAALFALIPIVFLKARSLPLTMLFIILFVFVMSLWRAPVVALMPDLTPPSLRSEGNAVINLMGGLGSAIGMVAGTLAIILCGLFTGLTKAQIKADETVSFPYVFAIGAVIMIIGMLVIMLFVKEPDSRIHIQGEVNKQLDADARRKAEKEAKKAEKAARKAQKLSKGERKSLIFMLAALFFLFCGSNAITTFFSLFAQEILHMITSEATIIMLIFAVVAAIAALPAGKMGKKIGRKKTIIAGLAIFLSAFVIFFSIFLVMLGRQNMSIGNYVTVNNAYTSINDKVNAYNSELADAAKENNITLGEGDTLVMDTYVEYVKAKEANGDLSGYGSVYADFDAKINAENPEIINGIRKVAVSTLELSEQSSFGEALEAVSGSVRDVTRILRILIYPVLILGGAANMFITVNTLPLVLEIGGLDKVGTFTGYYYTATFSAQIASPIVYGIVRMFSGTYMSLFYYAPVAFAASILCILLVKHGEAIPDEVIKEAEEKD
ncbi:MAG: MFS transporter, partial [Oscillospiraceae bacterium]|nr:MFS transporter [Oscillospiraceae bacterium]